MQNERWCLPPSDSVAGHRCVEAFRANGLDVPAKTVIAISVHLQLGLLATERFFTMFPGSLMQFGASRLSIMGLPIALPVRALPIGILTLKGRTISPAASLFIEAVRSVASSFARTHRARNVS